MKNNPLIKKELFWCFTIFLFALLLYGNSMKNKYALDDEMVTLNNERVEKGIGGIKDILTKHHAIEKNSHYEYRPVVLITFALEYEFFGRNPFISHAVNVLLYAMTCMLVFYLIRQLLPAFNIVLPLLAAFLFTAHPLHTEAVNNLKSRDELLALASSLMALFFILQYVRKGKIISLCAGIFMLLLALLSKKSAAIFILLIPLVLYFFSGAPVKRILLIGCLGIVAYGLFVVIKKVMLSEPAVRHFHYFENPLFFEHGLMKRFPAGLYTLWRYIELLVFPHPLSYYYGYNQEPVAGWAHPKVWLSLVFYTGIFIYAVKNFIRNHILSFAILFYLIAIFPFSNIPVPVVGIIGERFAYAASLGFCIVVSYVLMKLFNMGIWGKTANINIPFTGVVLVILSLYSFKVIARNHAWKDHLTLYRHDIKHLAGSAKAHSLISNTIYPGLFNIPDGEQKSRLIKEAIFHYEKSLEIYPEYIVSNNNLGSIYFTFLGDYRTALPCFRKAVMLDSTYVDARFNLASTYEILDLKDSAVLHFEKVLTMQPDHRLAYDKLYFLYFNALQYDKAIELNLRAAVSVPQWAAMYYVNTGNVFTAKHDTISALQYFIKALEREPGNRDLCLHIGEVFRKTGNHAKAGEYFRMAEKIP